MNNKSLKRIISLLIAIVLAVTTLPADKVKAAKITDKYEKSFYYDGYIKENWLDNFKSNMNTTTEYNTTHDRYVLYCGQTYTAQKLLNDIEATGVKYSSRLIKSSDSNVVSVATNSKSFTCKTPGKVYIKGYGSGSKNNTEFTEKLLCGKYFIVVDVPINKVEIKVVSSSAKVGGSIVMNATTSSAKSTVVPTNVTYQWYKNGVAISGATKASYTTPTLTIGDNGSTYYCIVQNSSGAKTSKSVKISVSNVEPVITMHPASVANLVGEKATFTVGASGTNLQYQWYKATDSATNGVAISGATKASYTTPALTISDNGTYYYCVVSNVGNTPVTTGRALVIVNNTVPTIESDPEEQLIKIGEKAKFCVGANGTNLQYQWYKAVSNTASGTIINGATASEYTFIPEIEDNGTYYYCKVSNTGNTEVMSERAKLKLYCNVYLNPNGGDCQEKELKQVIGENYKLPFPTKAGCFFTGWYTKAIGGEKISNTMLKEDGTDITLYAHWSEASQFVYNNILYTVTDVDKNYVEAMFSYETEKYGTGQQNNSSINNVIIPETVRYAGKDYVVTGIANNSFDSCQYIYTVIIPETVTSIGEYAFYNCCNLNEVVIPDSVADIGSSAFQNCEKLKEIKIPEKVKIINENTFSGCSRLSNIKLPANLLKIKNGAFKACTELIKLELPKGLSEIGEYVFSGNRKMENLLLPDTLKQIGEYAFQNCETFTNMYIPKGISIINKGLFEGCTELDTVVFQGEITAIKESAFADCRKLNNILIPETVTEIGNYAFANCKSIASIVISDTLHTVGKGIFDSASITICYSYKKDVSEMNKIFENASITNMYINDKNVYQYEEAFINTDIMNKLTFHIISFHENYGNDNVTAVRNVEGAEIIMPVTQREGYTFKGWSLKNTDVAAIYEGNSLQAFGKNTDLYAVWQVNKYNVVFEASGGKASYTNKKVVHGGMYGELPKAERAGYTFKGWYTSAIGGKRILQKSLFNLAADQTLYAQWEVVNITELNMQSKKTLYADESFTLKVTTKPSNAFKDISFSSSNKKIAVVNKSGKVTAKKNGTVLITATDKNTGLKKNCLIIIKPRKYSKVEIVSGKNKKINIVFGTSRKTITKNTNLQKGKQLSIKVQKLSTKEKITYKSSNVKILKVTKSGKVKAVKKGTAYITVKNANTTVKLKIKVK